MAVTRLLAVALLGCGLCASAHDGEVHADPSAADPSTSTRVALERPLRLSDGSLRVSTAMQALLKLRSEAWSAAKQPQAVQTLIAAVQAQPEAALSVIASERGRLAAPAGGWRLPGQPVAAGQVLAWLHPLLSQQERTERRARLARMDAELAIVDINVERQQLQSAVNSDNGGVASGNIWAEKYLAERDALRRNRELLAQSLDDRIALRAAHAGRVMAVAAAPGSTVDAGAIVVQLSDAGALQLVALHQQAGLGAGIVSATLADGSPLRLRSEEPLADGSGWRLRFDLAAGHDRLHVGQLTPLRVAIRPGTAQVRLPAGACVRRADGGGEIWLQRAAERYEARRVIACDAQGAVAAASVLNDGERVVTAGGALLSRYR